MRYLHVNAAYPPFLGGAEVYTQAISERLVDEGHTVMLVTTNAAEVEYFWNPRKCHVSPGRERVNGVKVIRCQLSHLPFSPWSFYALRRLVTTLARLAPLRNSQFVNYVFRRLAPYMPGVPDIEATLTNLPGPFDLVHGVNVSLEWPLLAAWHYARQQGLPFVATPFVHVGEYGKEDVLINYTMPHQLEALCNADAVVVQTDIEKRALIQRGVKEKRLHRLGMGVDLNELQGGNAKRFRKRYDLSHPIVTFLGVVTYDKGSFHLVKAMERLWSRGQDVHIVIAGPQVNEFIQFYNRLPSVTRERILLLGPVLGQDKQDLLAATDIFVLPSRIDSFGIVYLEAWAYANPVIGSRAGGVPDVIEDGKDGLLVKFGDIAGITEAIEGLLASPAQARAMGLLGQNKVESQYTWDRIYNRLRMIYKRLVN
jgi:glycogen synthase